MTESSPSSRQADHKPNLLLIGFIILLIFLAASGWFLYLTGGSVSLPVSSETETPSEEVTPSPSPPTPTPVDKSAISLEVLNGSGVSGAAGETSASLEALGYTITETGNADASDYEITQVYVAKNFEHQELLLSDLESEFGEASMAGELEESTPSARLIVGKNWFKD